MYFKMDTAALIEYFIGMTKEYNDNICKYAYWAWNQYFNLGKKIFGFNKRKRDKNGKKKKCRYMFDFSIETDGIGVSLLFRNADGRKAKQDKRDAEQKKRVENIDKTDAEKELEKELKLQQTKQRRMQNKDKGKTKTKDKDNNEFPYIDQLSYEQFKYLIENRIVVNGDTGKRFMIYLSDGIHKLAYSCMQRDTESNAKRNREIMKHRKHMFGINDAESILCEESSKTTDYDDFGSYITLKHKVNEIVRQEYEKPIYRKMKLRAQIARHQSEDNFLNKIEEIFGHRDDIVLIIGDHTNANRLKNGSPSMGIGLKRLLATRFLVFHINEYYTSQKCCNCWGNIENAYMDKKYVHRLVMCKNANCYRRELNWEVDSLESAQHQTKKYHVKNNYYTRDLNSCICMLGIVYHMYYNNMQRPHQFTRNVKAEEQYAKEATDQLTLLKGKMKMKLKPLKATSDH